MMLRWLAMLMLCATPAAALTMFLPQSVTTDRDTAVVSVELLTDVPLEIMVQTMEYDGTVAKFERFELGAGCAGWEVLAVNDNQHFACAAVPPLKRVTALWSAPLSPCTEILDGEVGRFVFSRVAYGATDLYMPAMCAEQGWNPNHGSSCDGRLGFAVDGFGRLTFATPSATAVAPVTWSWWKAVNR